MTLINHAVKTLEPQYLSIFAVEFDDSEVLTEQLVGIDLCDGHATFNVNTIEGMAQPIQEILEHVDYPYDVTVKLMNKSNKVTMAAAVKELRFDTRSLNEAVVRQMKLHYANSNIMEEIRVSWTCKSIDLHAGPTVR